MNGIYAMYYTGTVGSGFAVFVMKGGIITGAESTGGMLDGTYGELPEGKLDVLVKLTVPPGTRLVTGAVAGAEPMSQEIRTVIPRNFADGNALPIKTPTGPVNVIFKKLRTL